MRVTKRPNIVAVVPAILAIASLATVLGLLFELVLPASARFIAIAAAVCGAATWIAPPVISVLFWNRRKRSGGSPTDQNRIRVPSLVAVGHFIGLLVIAATFSVVGLALAVPTLIFTRAQGWAWFAVAAIVAFWVSGFTVLVVTDSRKRQAKQVSPRGRSAQ